MTARFFEESSFDDLFPQSTLERFSDLSGSAWESDGPEFELAIDAPHAIVIPEHFEPGYAYPLIVWLPANGQTEHQIQSVLPQISERNYLGVSLRGSVPAVLGYDWALETDALNVTRQAVAEVVKSMSRCYRVHPQRVYLAGQGMGGSLAVRFFLEQPDQFAGAVCVNAEFPQMDQPLRNFRALKGKRLLLSTTQSREASTRLAHQVNSGRMLYQAGVEVATRVYQPAAANLFSRQLREIDHWIMDAVNTAIRCR